MKSNATWITGVGAATPLGNTFEAIAANLLQGRSGVRKVNDFSVADHPSQIAGMMEPPASPRVATHGSPLANTPFSKLDRATLWCCVQALDDAGLWHERENLRVGLVLGNAAEWNTFYENDYLAGGRRVLEPQEQMPGVAERTALRLGLRGPVVNLSAACASGNFALALGRRWLRLGWVDAVLAGACDTAVTPATMAGFGNLRALSRRNDEPQAASRPFDRDRDGFVMGEGGAMFVLESERTARRRSARVHAELAGCGASSDAHHMVIPSPDPAPAMAAMRQALADADVDPSAIDYVNAHATSTPVGDAAEARALAGVFGSGLDRVPVSSTKSMSGHLLSATAAFEALACIVALRHGAIPPTINLHHPDPECPLFHVANLAMQRPIRHALSNSFGFGGSNTSIVLRAA